MASSHAREPGGDPSGRGALSEQLLHRIIELEDENRALRSDLVTLSSSYTAAMSKNNLFQAKILELQARIDVGNNPSAMPPPKMRYRFERNPPKLERPASARHASGAMSAREPLSSRRATENGRPAGVSKLILNNLDKGARRKVILPVAAASSNPRSVDRIFKELRRTSEHPEHLDSARSAGLSTARSRKEEEEEEREVQAIEAGLRALDEDARAGRIGKGSKLVLDVCYCVDLGQRSLAVKQKPERYRVAAAELRDAIGVTFEGWNVQVTVSEVMHNPESADAKAHVLGSFEVSLHWWVQSEARTALLHSKARTHTFPDVFDLLSGLLKVLSSRGGGGGGGSSSEGGAGRGVGDVSVEAKGGDVRGGHVAGDATGRVAGGGQPAVVEQEAGGGISAEKVNEASASPAASAATNEAANAAANEAANEAAANAKPLHAQAAPEPQGHTNGAANAGAHAGAAVAPSAAPSEAREERDAAEGAVAAHAPALGAADAEAGADGGEAGGEKREEEDQGATAAAAAGEEAGDDRKEGAEAEGEGAGGSS